MLYEGKVEIRFEGPGSKSEGRYAHLIMDKKDYVLYRENIPVANDVFFEIYDGLKVQIQGEAQERVHYLHVQSIRIIEK